MPVDGSAAVVDVVYSSVRSHAKHSPETVSEAALALGAPTVMTRVGGVPRQIVWHLFNEPQ